MSVACMVCIAFDATVAADLFFAAGLFAMLLSLALLIIEVSISMKALDLQLSDLEGDRPAEAK